MFFNDNLNDSIPEDKIAYFIMSPINSDLCSVPGVSERNKNCFIDYGIVNTYQLFSLLMSFNNKINTEDKDISSEIYSKSYQTLKDNIKINEFDIDVILKSCFGKIDCIMPGFIDMVY